MIIQCRQCRTKYTFDDALVQQDGVWVRCSRCQHVFFQENPQAIKPQPEAAKLQAYALGQYAVSGLEDDDHSYEAMLASGKDADTARFLSEVMEGKDSAATLTRIF